MIEEYTLEHMDSLDNNDLAGLISLIDTVNGNKSIGSSELWSALSSELKKRGGEGFNEQEICHIFAAFAKANAINKDIQAVSLFPINIL